MHIDIELNGVCSSSLFSLSKESPIIFLDFSDSDFYLVFHIKLNFVLILVLSFSSSMSSSKSIFFMDFSVSKI